MRPSPAAPSRIVSTVSRPVRTRFASTWRSTSAKPASKLLRTLVRTWGPRDDWSLSTPTAQTPASAAAFIVPSPHVLTSVLKSFRAGFAEVLRQVEAKRVRTGRDTVLTMRDGAAGLGRVSPRVPHSLAAQVEELRQRIVAGTVRVPGVAATRRAE